MKRLVFLVLIVLAALPGERIVAQDAPVTTALTGSAFVYAVRAGDSLRTIGARFGASTSTLVRQADRCYGGAALATESAERALDTAVAASARRSAAFFKGLSMANLISSTPGAT